jgi:hypothetical protein
VRNCVVARESVIAGDLNHGTRITASQGNGSSESRMLGLNADKEDEYCSDRLAKEIINALAKIQS